MCLVSVNVILLTFQTSTLRKRGTQTDPNSKRSETPRNKENNSLMKI